MKKLIFGTGEVADMFGISLRTLARHLRAERIKTWRLGGRKVIVKRDVEALEWHFIAIDLKF